MQGKRPQTGFTPFQGLYPQQSVFLAKPFRAVFVYGQMMEGGAPLRLGMRRNALKTRQVSCSAPPVPAEKEHRRMDRINESGP